MSTVLTKIEDVIEDGVKYVEKLFTSGTAQAVIAEAATLVNNAIPVIQEIDAPVPNKTGPEIILAATKLLGADANLQPILQEAVSNPTGALLALATTVLQKNLPAAKSVPALGVLTAAVKLAQAVPAAA